MTTLTLAGRSHTSVRTELARAWRELTEAPVEVLALKLTLVLFILHGYQSWHLNVSLSVLCGIAVVCTSLARSPLLWLGITAAMIWSNALDWYKIDNHKYLITYWCAACTLALASADPRRVMQVNARWLLALCFLFATLWKVLTGEFADGSFLEYTFLTDDRVASATALFGGMTIADLATNRQLLSTIEATQDTSLTAVLHVSDRVRMIALLSSYWTILIEGVLALAFFMPRSSWLGRARDWLLMVFIATTYVLLPVTGFAFMLALLGFMQCPAEARRTRSAYLLVFLGVQFIKVPWFDLAYELSIRL